MGERSFRLSVAALAALRILPPLVVLAASGRRLPGLPSYAYGPPTGDTYGFYAAAREFVSAWAHTSKPLLGFAVLALAAALWVAGRLWRRDLQGEAAALASLAVGAFVAVGVHSMVPTGAGAVGWPIVWSVPMFPLRAAGVLSYHVAFYAGIAILLACNVVTLVATALIARRFVRGGFALVAPALLVAWPFAMRAIEGGGNIVYGSWLDDTGLLLYSEPLSTALVVTALALFVLRPGDLLAIAASGALIGFATAVRISDITVAVVLAIAVALFASRYALGIFVVACAGGGAIVASFWSLGYATFSGGKSERAPNRLFSWHYLMRSWRDSAVFDWRLLIVLVPLAIAGGCALRRHAPVLVTLVGTIVVTAAFYSAYYITALHPRFLFVALPALFVLIAAALAWLSQRAGREPAPTAASYKR